MKFNVAFTIVFETLDRLCGVGTYERAFAGYGLPAWAPHGIRRSNSGQWRMHTSLRLQNIIAKSLKYISHFHHTLDRSVSGPYSVLAATPQYEGYEPQSMRTGRGWVGGPHQFWSKHVHPLGLPHASFPPGLIHRE